MIPDDVLAAAMVKVPDRHLGFPGGWEPAVSPHEVRVILEAAVAALMGRLKAEVADELTVITAETVIEAEAVSTARIGELEGEVANLRAALREAAVEMDRRYALGAAAERKRVSQCAREVAAEHRDAAIRVKSTKAAVAAGHYASAVDAFADQIGDSG